RCTRFISSPSLPARGRCSIDCAPASQPPRRTFARRIHSTTQRTSAPLRGWSSQGAVLMNTTTVDLRTAAAAEAQRLAAARRLVPDEHGHRAEPPGPLIARARSSRLRQALDGRLLFVWRIACDDGSGRVAASTVVATMAVVDAQPRTRTWQSW